MTTTEPHALRAQLLRFAVVGGAGFAVDVAVFTALRLGPLSPQHLALGPVVAKAVSTSVAVVANWLGSRYWTFAARRGGAVVTEAVRFGAASALGLLVGVGCLAVSHYLLGLTSVLDDDISSNVVGLLLGAAVRFVLYRAWVYRTPLRRAA